MFRRPYVTHYHLAVRATSLDNKWFFVLELGAVAVVTSLRSIASTGDEITTSCLLKQMSST